MLIELDEIRSLMIRTCERSGVPASQVELVVGHYLDGELRGKKTHGLAKFCFESQYFHERQGPPEITHDRKAITVVNARREVGPISAAFATDIAVRKARRFGVGMVGVVNSQRYGILATWTERMAGEGCVGVAMNTSTADVTLPGAGEGFLGVNPLSFAVPTADEPLVADMSTTKAPMGLLWEARRGGQALPPGCFVDRDGHYTLDPDDAVSAVMFGEHKGFAISLLVQLLTGSIFGFPMGTEVDSIWRTGYTFLALDPAFGGAAADFVSANSRLVESIENVRTTNGSGLRLFSRNGLKARNDAIRVGLLEVSDSVLERLRSCASGDHREH
ncbi:Ldh family oxidoreductase [Amycolatopsis coloradensis]|uniref:Ldh family oxidoreductase n=1 Tax=Amycolatopsis coloradensis TaxID=76021 RepID=A0ACD5BJW3_9PSEU